MDLVNHSKLALIGLMVKIKDMRHKIRFQSIEDIEHFIAEVEGLSEDVNIYYGHQEFDGKSILALLYLELGKEYETEILSNNEISQDIFRRIVANFGG